MQEQSQATGTWRIGFDLAGFVLLATISGMAAAVTLASIALLLSGVVASTPQPAAGAPLTIPEVPAAPAGAPAVPHAVPSAPHSLPASPDAEPADADAPGGVPAHQTQLVRAVAPANWTAAASAGRRAGSSPGFRAPPRSPASAQKSA